MFAAQPPVQISPGHTPPAGTSLTPQPGSPVLSEDDDEASDVVGGSEVSVSAVVVGGGPELSALAVVEVEELVGVDSPEASTSLVWVDVTVLDDEAVVSVSEVL